MPDGFTIFGLKIYFYGILIMLGALAAAWIASRRAREYGYDSETAWDILPWALIGGIIGARIWHILTPPASMVAQGITTQYYLTHPLDMLNIRNGGLGIPGAVMGGFLAVYLYTRRKGQNIWTWADIISPGLALAQAVGRWGNFFNQELYGQPTNLPWKIFIAPEKRLPQLASIEYYHPMFFYEFLWNMMNATILILVGRRFKDRLKPGDLFIIYVLIYAIGRFALEFMRLDPSPVAGLNANQTLMLVLAILSAALLLFRHRPGQVAPVLAAAAAGAPIAGSRSFADVSESEDELYDEDASEDDEFEVDEDLAEDLDEAEDGEPPEASEETSKE